MFALPCFVKGREPGELFHCRWNIMIPRANNPPSSSANRPPNFTFLPPPICSTPWRVARASPTCPNRTWLQIRFCPHPVLRKDRVKQLTSHVSEHRCKGDKQAEPLNISTPPPSSRGRAGRSQPILTTLRGSSQVQGHLFRAWVSFHFLLHCSLASLCFQFSGQAT